MSVLAKTEAAGGGSLHPDVLSFSSSLADDRALLREDMVGSLAHVIMLAKTGIIPVVEARALKDALQIMWDEDERGELHLPEEEDVHMAIEALLGQRLGPTAKMLHAARSRNDQVATALRLHVREHSLEIESALIDLVGLLIARAKEDRDLLIPSYTHRQRAQLVSVAHYCLAWASMFQRDIETFAFVRGQANFCPLGSGAIAGSTLPVDRELTARLLGFDGATANARDTVGDRDFITDYLYAASRFLVHSSRLATDMVDFSTSEFGFVELDDEIACGSSMMPQKKNPDVFELVRGKSGPQIGALVALLVTAKGLPSGYNRDLQEDRRPLLDTSIRLRGVLDALHVALPLLRFRRDKCLQAASDSTLLATDIAEALVKRGVAFRAAYEAVGKLVRLAAAEKVGLGDISVERARELDPAFDADVLACGKVEGALERRITPGGAGLASVDAQIESHLKLMATRSAALGSAPRLHELFAKLKAETL